MEVFIPNDTETLCQEREFGEASHPQVARGQILVADEDLPEKALQCGRDSLGPTAIEPLALEGPNDNLYVVKFLIS